MSKVGAYLHLRPDDSVFYVGKGTLKRMGDMSTGRNTWHRNITNKYGRSNIGKVFIECSNESTAFMLEEGLIKCLRRSNVELVNITNGGEKAGGYVPTPEAIAKSAEKNRGRVQSVEERKLRSHRNKGINSGPKSKEHLSKIAAKMKGRKWYNNGKNVVFTHEGTQPEGYVRGRLSRELISLKQEEKLCLLSQ